MTPPATEMLSHLTDKQRLRIDLILKRILDRRQVTRAELSDSLGMSGSSIAKYVKMLLDAGFVREAGNPIEGQGGRSAVLELEASVGFNIAIVLRLNTVSGGLVNLRGDVVETRNYPVYYGINSHELLELIQSLIRELVESVAERGKNLFGIGIAMGGALDQRSGVSHGYRYASDWGIVPVKSMIEDEFRVPCFVLHDTNAVVAGEKYFGFGLGVPNFLTVWIADGVSLGAVINGEIYLGNDGYLGEFGHIQAEESGPLCYCGHSGCLETVTKESFIVERAVAGLRSGVHSEISALSSGDPDNIRIDDLKTAANNGDRFCKLIFEEAAGHLGRKLSDIINVLNPGLVTFRGSVIDGNHFFFENIQRIILNRSVRNISNSIQLKYAEVDDQIQMRGLGSWVLTNYFVGQ